MTAKEFFKLTARVRELQKEYFKTRDKTILEQSRLKERELDAEIARAMPYLETNNT